MLYTDPRSRVLKSNCRMAMGRVNLRAVFLDRDGVLNELVLRNGEAVSPRRVEDFRLCQGAVDAVKRLRALGMRILVASNQPDIARGFLSWAVLERMTAILTSSLPIDEVAICPHDDADGCQCRKPKPGMLLGMAARWNIDLRGSFVIGDSWRDVEAGRASGCRTLLVGSKAAIGGGGADYLVKDLADAVVTVESIVQRGVTDDVFGNVSQPDRRNRFPN